MTRSTCFVKGCKNGYLRRRRENVCLGARPKRMFRSPKCAELRKKWCLALGVGEDQFKPHNVVCEDHFEKKYIIKYDVTLLRDGTTFLLERERCRLHPEAVPSIDPIVASTTTKTFCPSRVTRAVSKGLDQSSIESPTECSYVTIDSPTECANVTVQFLKVTRPIECTVEECSTQVENQQTNFHRASMPTECQKECKDISAQVKDPVPVVIRTAYSFAELLMDVKQCGRLTKWASVVNKDTIDFLNWDPLNFRTTMVLRVSKDLGMKLYASDKHLIKKVRLWPKSFQDVLHTLRLMEEITLCEGTGLKGRRPAECSGEVDAATIETRRGVWKRCQPCCALRKKELKRQRELKRGLQNRLKLTNRKNGRLKMMVNKLKEDIERAKKECARIQEKVLHDRIQALPLPVQESVRTCLATANVKPRGRRYTTNWIYECLLIRMKSRSMYEHLRTHFILPLPCIDTLDRYIKKFKETHDLDGETFESLENKLATTMGIEGRSSIVIDEIEFSEGPDFDDAEVLRTAEETEDNRKLVEL